MKKLFLLCILLTLCTCLASCDEAIVVNPGSATSSTKTDIPSASTETVETIPSIPMTTDHSPITVPVVEKTEMIYDEPVDLLLGFDYTLASFSDYLIDVSLYENYSAPYAICKVTLNSIDLSQDTEWSASNLITKPYTPVTLTIDKILEKNSYFMVNDGATVTVEGNCWVYDSEGVLHAIYDVGAIPVAEVGETYIAVLLKNFDSTADEPYSIVGLSVPIPDASLLCEAYFQEYYERMHLSAANKILTESALIHYVYQDTAPGSFMTK